MIEKLSAERLSRIVRVVQSEFDEMPGMRLTRAQAQRLWHISADDFDHVLDRLTGEGRLICDATGRYSMGRRDF